MKFRIRLLGALALMAALSTTALDAQTTLAPKDFGTEDESILLIGIESFVPISGLAESDGELKWSIAPALRFLVAPLNTLPNGSLITRITYYFRDTDDGNNLGIDLCKHHVNAATGELLGDHCQGTFYPSGDSGDTYAIDPAVGANYRIQYRLNPGVGDPELVSPYILVRTPAGNATTAIRLVEVRWKREVSPAPQSATFGDVPTNHQFFQFIEALADSGVTAGCQANPPLFCPDRTLTRGEMAVFLAKALGLHWPWDAP